MDKDKKRKTDIFEITKEESEAFLGEATRAAIAEAHAAGRPTTHGDEKGVYRLYPDGQKEYIKIYEEGYSFADELDKRIKKVWAEKAKEAK